MAKRARQAKKKTAPSGETTQEKCQRLVAKNDLPAMEKLLVGMPESERRELFATVRKLERACVRERKEPNRALVLAVHGTGELKDARRVGSTMVSHLYGSSELVEALGRVLEARNPSWLGDWIRGNAGFRSLGVFEVTHRLTQAGLYQKEPTADYVNLVVVAFGNRSGRKPISQLLEEHPDLLEEELWWLFEMETEAFITKGGIYKQPPHLSWRHAVKQLASRGRIDRVRVIDACLDGLLLDFKSNVLQGYIAVHDSMSPSADEREARQEKYCNLLASHDTSVVKFALETLAALESRGGSTARGSFPRP